MPTVSAQTAPSGALVWLPWLREDGFARRW